jgi:hypothetical protein
MIQQTLFPFKLEMMFIAKQIHQYCNMFFLTIAKKILLVFGLDFLFCKFIELI